MAALSSVAIAQILDVRRPSQLSLKREFLVEWAACPAEQGGSNRRVLSAAAASPRPPEWVAEKKLRALGPAARTLIDDFERRPRQPKPQPKVAAGGWSPGSVWRPMLKELQQSVLRKLTVAQKSTEQALSAAPVSTAAPKPPTRIARSGGGGGGSRTQKSRPRIRQKQPRELSRAELEAARQRAHALELEIRDGLAKATAIAERSLTTRNGRNGLAKATAIADRSLTTRAIPQPIAAHKPMRATVKQEAGVPSKTQKSSAPPSGPQSPPPPSAAGHADGSASSAAAQVSS
jgi:hypothetical protein